MTGTAELRLSSAQNAFYKAKHEFQMLQVTLKGSQDAFNAGIEAWKTAKAWEAVGDVLTGIVAVAGGIALACAVPPAGAAGIGEGAAELGAAMEGTEEAVGLWERIKEIVENIQGVYEKLEPYLEKVQELVDSVNKIVELIKSVSSMDDIENNDIDKLKLPSTATSSDDVINSTADWETFRLQMNGLYDGIKEEQIEGADDFFSTINKMAIRGKALLATQIALSSASDAYLTVMQRSIAQKKHTDRLRQAIPQIRGNEKSLEIIKLAFAESLLALRSWIVLDFRQYVAAYVWNSLVTNPPISLDPMKDTGSFLNDAANLQALSAEIYSTVRAQTRVFYLSSGSLDVNNPLQVPPNFIESLKNSRSASFTISCDSPMFQYYGRIRVSKARIFLESSAASDFGLVSLGITLGASMRDLSLENTQTSITGPGGVTASRVLHFVTTESKFGFEYAGNSRDVLMDGAFCGYHDSSSLLLSPFRTWTVVVNSETNLDTLTGITVELTCDATYL
ncbi:hypothetical protein FSARC_14531 [Fusarium sarcochroum]|uniref:Uncharacterized protein n=1 Tax=Fusarium sarcochroum TaxID=1208366 RepID=A0A8H4SSJ2_9HYPO|nr:hypothetical protein FSARC_14531 [Fusarium sarcochroum]